MDEKKAPPEAGGEEEAAIAAEDRHPFLYDFGYYLGSRCRRLGSFMGDLTVGMAAGFLGVRDGGENGSDLQ